MYFFQMCVRVHLFLDGRVKLSLGTVFNDSSWMCSLVLKGFLGASVTELISLCWTWQALRTDVCSSVVVVFRQSYYLVSSSSEVKPFITTNSSLCSLLSILCSPMQCWMLCTLVIAIGTFPYVLCTVTIPWSLDQDMSNCLVGEVVKI